METAANAWTRKMKACTLSHAMKDGVNFMVGGSWNAHRASEIYESILQFSSVRRGGDKGSVVQHPVLGDGVDYHPLERVCISWKQTDGARDGIPNFQFITCRYERRLWRPLEPSANYAQSVLNLLETRFLG
jgi:hypothetical protein